MRPPPRRMAPVRSRPGVRLRSSRPYPMTVFLLSAPVTGEVYAFSEASHLRDGPPLTETEAARASTHAPAAGLASRTGTPRPRERQSVVHGARGRVSKRCRGRQVPANAKGRKQPGRRIGRGDAVTPPGVWEAEIARARIRCLCRLIPGGIPRPGPAHSGTRPPRFGSGTSSRSSPSEPSAGFLGRPKMSRSSTDSRRSRPKMSRPPRPVVRCRTKPSLFD